MKVKVTAMISCETELDPEHYEGVAQSDEDIIAWELQNANNAPDDSGVLSTLVDNGMFSDIKIEKLEETAAPAASEAA